jgi:hypothetical protein
MPKSFLRGYFPPVEPGERRSSGTVAQREAGYPENLACKSLGFDVRFLKEMMRLVTLNK